MNKIFNDNAIAIMDRMIAKDYKVDLVITDPPYPTTSRGCAGNSGGMLQKDINKKGKVFENNDIHVKVWGEKLYQILKETGHCYIMTNHKNLQEYLNVLTDIGFHFIKSLIWDKGNKIMGQYYMSQFEYILFFRKGAGVKINNCGTADILSIPNKKTKDNEGKNIHDTEKPIKLMRILIENSSKENEIVFDPFMGVGATCIASLLSNRQYIGVELDENYFKIAEKRIKKAWKEKDLKSMTLFGEEVKITKYLNEQQTTTPKVLTLDSHQFSQLVMNTNYSDGYFKDDTIVDRIKYFNITNISDSTPASFENAYYIVLLIGDKIIGVAKVDYYSKPTSVIRFFSIDKEYRGNGYSRLMADALFNEAKNRNKNITTALYTQLGKTHLQHLFNEYAKKHGVKFIDRKESDPLYQY